MEFIWIVLLVISIIWFSEKTKFRIMNFGAFILILYLAFQVENVLLMGGLIFMGIALMGYSVFGEN